MDTSAADSRSRISSLWRMRVFAHKYLGQMALMTFAALLATLAGIVVPLVVRQVIDGPLRHGDRAAIWPLGGLALLFGLAEAVLVFLRRWTMSTSALGLEADLRNELYQHMQKLPVAFHDRWQSGQLLSRATSDLSQIRRFIGFGLVFLVVNTVTFVVVTGLLMAIYWPLAVLVVILTIPLIWVMYKFERDYRARSRAVQDQEGELTTQVEESAGGIRTIKAFGRRQTIFERYDEHARTMRDLEMRKITLLAVIWSIIEAHPQLILGTIVLVGTIATVHGALTIGTLVAFVSLFLLLVWPITAMGWLLAAAQESATAADRVYEVLDSEPTIVDSPHPAPLARSEGRLRFEGVGFTYPGTGREVLHDIDLTIEPGETVALVGATGSGKTTLVALVPRLYDVTAGRITLDGVDIRDLTVSDLRSSIGTAFEEPTLFSASVRENLTLGRPEATEEEITEALAVAQAEFVYELPWGLDSRVGEQGLTLSGGQRQRLALARAVLGRPRLLVLDDPLSALDVHTEALVEEALRRVLTGTTGLVVAHRPSTVLLADRVALLEGGTLTAVGTHQELLATVPAYRDLLSQEAELGVPR
jgi:ATP-binding cassette, subfamily B, bacterial